MGSPTDQVPCNTFDGIRSYLTDLEGLNRLMSDRSAAAYGKDGEFVGGLKEFVILGRWSLGSNGGIGDMRPYDSQHRMLSDDEVSAMALKLPRVLTHDDFFRYAKDFGVLGISVSMKRPCIPPVRVKCRECGESWSLDNAHDSVMDSDTVEVDMSRYVGRTFRDLDNDLRSRTDGHCFIDGEFPLRSDRFIDRTPVKEGSDLVENDRGWNPLGHWNDYRRGNDPAGFMAMMARLGQPDLAKAGAYDPWNYRFQAGDHTYGHRVHYTHKRCLALKRSRSSRDYYVSLFKEAGFPEPVTREVPNERCQGLCCLPWQVAQFPFGDIKIGWRSSVISIDWSGVKGSPNYESLFDDVDGTKWPHGVHAGGREACVEYLGRLRMAIDAGLSCSFPGGCPFRPVHFFLDSSSDLVCRCETHAPGVPQNPLTFLQAVIHSIHRL